MKKLPRIIILILVLALSAGTVPAFAAQKSTSKWSAANYAVYNAVAGAKTEVSVAQYLIPSQDADFFIGDFLCNYPELYYLSVSEYTDSGKTLGTISFEYNGLNTDAAAQAKSVSKLSAGCENRFFYEALNWADEGDLLVDSAKFSPFSASPRSTIVTYLYNFYK